jgi:hypothetical protein
MKVIITFTPEVLAMIATVDTIDVNYGDWRDSHAAAEMAFVRLYGKLPQWAQVIESFEVINGAYLWVHRDTYKVDA